MRKTLPTAVVAEIEIISQPIEKISGMARSAASIAEMVAAAAAEVNTAPAGGAAPAGGVQEESSSGIQIERQDIERVQGQAKSGIAT